MILSTFLVYLFKGIPLNGCFQFMLKMCLVGTHFFRKTFSRIFLRSFVLGSANYIFWLNSVIFLIFDFFIVEFCCIKHQKYFIYHLDLLDWCVPFQNGEISSVFTGRKLYREHKRSSEGRFEIFPWVRGKTQMGDQCYTWQRLNPLWHHVFPKIGWI